ncbi:MAG: glycosyl transferase [Thermonema sp.]|uniref:glycosyltransferase n=1 Tax=Thermonema sp. TaxID=2231181 RepID=UPI0021DBF77C|nr:glycosyltransferase [Thermonema sp.]GIV39654.1 MAG: glycosyl transferase [Thermonema sp.]
MKVLYISPDGMTDPLGQSQVIPYLNGLAEKGASITLLSLEKPERWQQGATRIARSLHPSIDWQPVRYYRRPPLLAQWANTYRLYRRAAQLHRQKAFDFAHARSYIGAWVALRLKHRHGVPFLFDMRGFWADERSDGNIWKRNHPLHRLIYNYFKKKEQQFLKEAKRIVSLTHAARRWMASHWQVPAAKMEVIPCCVDLQHFSKLRTARICTPQTPLRLIYLGSLGTWYLLDEMLRFFHYLRMQYPLASFLIVTREPQTLVEAACARLQIPIDGIEVRPAERHEVPELLAGADIGLFFIKPAFSKMASSATKMGEMLACGLPVIANEQVGDHDFLFSTYSCGALLRSKPGKKPWTYCYEEHAFEEVVRQIPSLISTPPEVFRTVAQQYFSLEEGIERYWKVYQSMM